MRLWSVAHPCCLPSPHPKRERVLFTHCTPEPVRPVTRHHIAIIYLFMVYLIIISTCHVLWNEGKPQWTINLNSRLQWMASFKLRSFNSRRESMGPWADLETLAKITENYIVTWMDTALLGNRPRNTSRPNTRKATIWEYGVFYGIRAATVAMQSLGKHVPTM
jgi:hypothetical protein